MLLRLSPGAVPLLGPRGHQMANLLSRRKKNNNKKKNTQPSRTRKKCWCVLGGLVETPRRIPPKGGARAGSRPPAGPAAFFLDSLTIWGLNFCLKKDVFLTWLCLKARRRGFGPLRSALSRPGVRPEGCGGRWGPDPGAQHKVRKREKERFALTQKQEWERLPPARSHRPKYAAGALGMSECKSSSGGDVSEKKRCEDGKKKRKRGDKYFRKSCSPRHAGLMDADTRLPWKQPPERELFPSPGACFHPSCCRAPAAALSALPPGAGLRLHPKQSQLLPHRALLSL